LSLSLSLRSVVSGRQCLYLLVVKVSGRAEQSRAEQSMHDEGTKGAGIKKKKNTTRTESYEGKKGTNGLAWGLTQRKRRERARAKSVKQRESLGEEDDTPQWKKVRCYYDDYEDYDCLDPIPDSIYIPYTSPCTLPSCYRTVRRLSHSVCGYLSYLLHTYPPLRGVCSFLCIYILTFPLTTDHFLLAPSAQQQHHASAIHL